MKRTSRNPHAGMPTLVEPARLCRARGGLVSNFNLIKRTDDADGAASDYNPDAVTNDGPSEMW
jgi:hypothetical protein